MENVATTTGQNAQVISTECSFINYILFNENSIFSNPIIIFHVCSSCIVVYGYGIFVLIDILQKMVVNEVGQLLWTVFTHAAGDPVRVTALSVSIRTVCIYVCVCVCVCMCMCLSFCLSV